MARSIKYTQTAIGQIREAAQYLAENYSAQARENLISKIESIEEKLIAFPESGRPSKLNLPVRYVLVGKNRRLYYKYSGKMVTVLALFDTRQNPEKEPF